MTLYFVHVVFCILLYKLFLLMPGRVQLQIRCRRFLVAAYAFKSQPTCTWIQKVGYTSNPACPNTCWRAKRAYKLSEYGSRPSEPPHQFKPPQGTRVEHAGAIRFYRRGVCWRPMSCSVRAGFAPSKETEAVLHGSRSPVIDFLSLVPASGSLYQNTMASFESMSGTH